MRRMCCVISIIIYYALYILCTYNIYLRLDDMVTAPLRLCCCDVGYILPKPWRGGSVGRFVGHWCSSGTQSWEGAATRQRTICGYAERTVNTLSGHTFPTHSASVNRSPRGYPYIYRSHLYQI